MRFNFSIFAIFIAVLATADPSTARAAPVRLSVIPFIVDLNDLVLYQRNAAPEPVGVAGRAGSPTVRVRDEPSGGNY